MALGPLALGLGVSTGLLVLFAAWEYAFGHLGYLREHALGSREMVGPRIQGVLIVLTGFLIGGNVYARRALVNDIRELGPTLRSSRQELDALARAAAGPAIRAGGWIGSLVAIPMGLLVITSSDPTVPFLLSDDSWNHDLVWALALNVGLFAILGRITAQTFRTNQLFARIEAQLVSVDLLRPAALAPFARRGLRSAFFWIGGSSIASVVFVNQDFSWLTGLVLVATLGIGTLAFLLPMRGLHRRLRAAKQGELERVRSAIERARDELLGGANEAGDPMRMTGLLAYEQRIAAAPEWPLDTRQVVRFGLVVALGLGSWVGGAVVEHLLDALW